MRKYIIIGCGAFLGAILRYEIKDIQINSYLGNALLTTIIINVTGAFALAFVLTIAFEIWDFNMDIRLGIEVGFIGAFTTFSLLCKETAGLLNSGSYFPAICYIIVSTTLGLAAIFLGNTLARVIGTRVFSLEREEIE